MTNFIGQIALVVKDYDEAIQFYTTVLGFTLIEDTTLSPDKRWVVVRPDTKVDKGCSLLLAKASSTRQKAFIGDQTGGRVFLFLYTDDFEAFYQKLLSHNVTIVRSPQKEAYGTVLVFQDLYGNLWDLIERS